MKFVTWSLALLFTACGNIPGNDQPSLTSESTPVEQEGFGLSDFGQTDPADEVAAEPRNSTQMGHATAISNVRNEAFIHRILVTYDTNRDGVLSSDEMQVLLYEVKRRLDRNRHRLLTRRRIASHFEPKPTQRQLYRQRRERLRDQQSYTRRRDALIHQLRNSDLNQDGSISAVELALNIAALESLRQRGEREVSNTPQNSSRPDELYRNRRDRMAERWRQRRARHPQ